MTIFLVAVPQWMDHDVGRSVEIHIADVHIDLVRVTVYMGGTVCGGQDSLGIDHRTATLGDGAEHKLHKVRVLRGRGRIATDAGTGRRSTDRDGGRCQHQGDGETSK